MLNANSLAILKKIFLYGKTLASIIVCFYFIQVTTLRAEPNYASINITLRILPIAKFINYDTSLSQLLISNNEKSLSNTQLCMPRNRKNAYALINDHIFQQEREPILFNAARNHCINPFIHINSEQRSAISEAVNQQLTLTVSPQ